MDRAIRNGLAVPNAFPVAPEVKRRNLGSNPSVDASLVNLNQISALGVLEHPKILADSRIA